MNLKKLTTLLFAGVTAATPLVTSAQNPTILQGNYISNVFGQANFVLNPNAQTNVANVTLTNATATRSTTTPLVATSEWNVTVTSANGTAAWATRSFDAGMKNQNCEARFTYRGFQATSKAQIKQGANVVAELTLTPSATDPRIASINFPCGDLSAATTFVITDSATLSGTNEIGGIYVGLATNQANVAQAETVVLAEGGTAQSITGSTYNTVIFGTETKDSYGEYDIATGIFTAKRAGDYLISSTVQYGAYVSCSIGTNNALLISKNDDVTGIAGIQTDVFTQATSSTGRNMHASGVLSLAVGDTVRIKVYPCTNATLSTLPFFRHLKISRFPSSSELVVTPETQNVWGSVNHSGNIATSLFGGVAPSGTYTPFDNAAINTTRNVKGRCSAPSTNTNLGCKIENMPVGNYKVSFSGLQYNIMNATGQLTCSFKIQETTTSTPVAVGSQKIQYSSLINAPVYKTSTLEGVFENTALGDRNFIIQAAKTVDTLSGNTGSCALYSAPSGGDITDINITITPLDNASNSALYVQGPVKSAETGTAIPAGYVGEEKIASVSNTSFAASGVATNVASLVLPAGVWYVYAQIYFQGGGGTTITAVAGGISTSSATLQADSFINIPLSTTQDYSLSISPRVISTPGTTIYLVGRATYSSGTPQSNGTFTKLKAIRIN